LKGGLAKNWLEDTNLPIVENMFGTIEGGSNIGGKVETKNFISKFKKEFFWGV
jgi:hypothetical protein